MIKTRLKKALIGLIIGLLSAAVSAEIGSRLLVARGVLPNRMAADLFAPHRIGWALEPGLDARIFSTNGIVEILVNEDGYRDKDYQRERAAGMQRLLVLGDSFTLALETPQEDTFHVLLEERYHGTVDVISTGVSGYEPLQEYLVYQHVGREYDPDVVLMMLYVGNDLMGTKHWPGLPYYSLETDGSLDLQNFPYEGEFNLPLVVGQRSTPIMQRSVAAFLMGVVFRNQSQQESVKSHQCGYLIGENYPNPNEDDWQLTEALILALRDAVEADGKIFRVAVIPTELQIEQANYEDFLAKCTKPAWNTDYQTRVDAFLESKNINYLDLMEPLKAARQASDNSFYLANIDIHWSGDGHAAAADALYEWLQLDAPQ